MARLLNVGETSFTGVDLSASMDVDLISYTVLKDVLVDVRADIGSTSGPLNASASNITISAWITRTSGEEVEMYSEVVSKVAGKTQLPYNFYKKLLLLAGQVITVTANSSNMLDTSISGEVYIFGRNVTYQSSTFTQSNITSEIEIGSYTTEHDYETFVRVDVGTSTYNLSGDPENLSIGGDIAGNTAYTAAITKSSGITRLIYMFDDPMYLRDGEELTVNIVSDNAADVTVSGVVYFALLGTTTRSSILDWIKNEFQPLTLATPDDTIYQQIDNAIRYWNTHSGYKVSSVVEVVTSAHRVQLNPEFKSVVQVWPTQNTEWILNDHPMWSLLGITILDNVTTDLILMSEAFKNYRQYVGTNFSWHFEKSKDQAIGGYLYYENVPSQNNALFVIGTKRITDEEDIEDDYILDWLLYYTLALVRIIEGNTLRKSDIISVKNDGQEHVNQGMEEKKTLQDKLFKESKWAARGKRFEVFNSLLLHVREAVDHDDWVCFDFDGVCAEYHGNFEENNFGSPVPGMAEAIGKVRDSGYKCTLFTTRKLTPELEAWLDENNFEFDSINSTEHNPENAGTAKPIAVLYVDDKGLHFSQDTPKESIKDIYRYLKIQETLTSHAEEELTRAGLFDTDSDYNGMLGHAVMELMKVFANQGHSGFSAQCTRELFNQLADYKVLSPITDNPSEWMDVAEYFDVNHPAIWQNRRDPSLFSNDGGKTYYSVDDSDRELKTSEHYGPDNAGIEQFTTSKRS